MFKLFTLNNKFSLFGLMDTLFVGRNMIFLPEVESTNSYAIGLLKNVNVGEGSVVYTHMQTNGRGQRGNVWKAEPHCNVTASFILKPVFLELKNQFFLYKIAALAAYDVMADLLKPGQFDIKIKWPNDVLVDRKKIAGILIENVIVNNLLAYSVIGIGINVRQKNFDAEFNASSLNLLTGKDLKPDEVLKALCTQIEKYYLLLKNRQYAKITEAYLARFFGLGDWMLFEVGNKVKKMLVKGIADNGLLSLEDEESKVWEFDVKEVKWLL